MRGENNTHGHMFTYLSPEQRVPKDHPLRAIKQSADQVLKELSPTFRAMYSQVGRPSIPPERLLKAQVLIALFSVRSDRLFCETLDYIILFRWFLDMNLEEPSWDACTFGKSRDRLLEHDVATKFFDAVVRMAQQKNLLSDEHFTVDGTLVEAWASMKSFQPKGEPPSDRPNTASRTTSSRSRGASRRNSRRTGSTGRSSSTTPGPASGSSGGPETARGMSARHRPPSAGSAVGTAPPSPPLSKASATGARRGNGP